MATLPFPNSILKLRVILPLGFDNIKAIPVLIDVYNIDAFVALGSDQSIWG